LRPARIAEHGEAEDDAGEEDECEDESIIHCSKHGNGGLCTSPKSSASAFVNRTPCTAQSTASFLVPVSSSPRRPPSGL
jgi:hypothetical protein